MPRLSIADLPDPDDRYCPDRYDPYRTGGKFETVAEARAEDLTRAALIRKACSAAEVPFDRDKALELACLLEECGSGEFEHETLASSFYMGRKRFRLFGALWKLLDDSSIYNTFTVFPRGWIFTAEELAQIDPRRLMNAFEKALRRRGALRDGGSLIGGIHGEFDPTSGLFHLHFHGVGEGEMLQVVDSLRELPKYRSRRSEGHTTQRVRVGRKALTDLPYPLTYVLQSYWPCRWRGEIEGVHRRAKTRGRIPDPSHTVLLLWLHQWRLKDVTLMMGMSVGRAGLTRNSRPPID